MIYSNLEVNMILVKNLYLKYIREYFALYDINLSIEDGEKVALVGEEHSGKTSLLRILAKLERPSKGEVYIKDIPIKKLNFKFDISAGYLPASPVFFEKKTVYENFKYILKYQKLNEADLENKINDALINFNIEVLKDKQVKELTLYEKYLISIVRLSFRSLDLVMIDNIFDALNDEEKEKIVALIKEQFSDKKITLIVATTSEKIAKELANRNIYFSNGSIVTKEEKA